MSHNNSPRVTVGLAVYNGEKYIHKAIDSILGQTYKNFDLIISDNNSFDKTVEICESYAKKDSRIKIIKNKVNVGAINNMNNIFYYSVENLPNNEFFNLIAYDDLWDSTYLEKSLEVLKNNDQALLCNASVKVLFPDGTTDTNTTEGVRYKSINTLNLSIEERFSLLWSTSNWFIFYGLFRIDKLKNIMPIPVVYGSDLVFATRMVLNGYFASIDERLLFYRLTEKEESEYQKIFFGDSKVQEKPFTQTLIDCIKEIFILDIPFNQKKGLYDIFVQILVVFSYNFNLVTKEHQDDFKNIFFRGIFTQTLNSIYDEEIILKENKTNKFVLDIDLKEYKPILLDFYKKNEFKSFNSLLKLIPLEYLDIELKYLSSLSNLKQGNSDKSSNLLRDLFKNDSENLNYLNNLIVSEFLNDNLKGIIEIFNNNLKTSFSNEILINLIKIFEYFEMNRYYQKSINYLQKKELILKEIKKNLKNDKKISIIVFCDDLFDYNSFIDKINKQFILYSNLAEVVFISNLSNIEEIRNKIVLSSLLISKNEDEEKYFYYINNAIRHCNGKYVCIYNNDVDYSIEYFVKNIDYFDSLEESVKFTYSPYKINDTFIYLMDWDRKSFIYNSVLRNNYYICSSFMWKKDIHSLYGFFDENNNIPKTNSIVDFILKISQTHDIKYFKDSFVSYNDKFKEKFSFNNLDSVFNKYTSNLDGKIVGVVKDKPNLDIFDHSLTLNNLSRIPFYIHFEYIKSNMNDTYNGFYMILFLNKDNLGNLDNLDIDLINNFYDQIWILDHNKDFFLEYPLDLIKVKVINLNELEIEINNFILNLKDYPIFRENRDLYEKDLYEKAQNLLNLKKYYESELCFASLCKINSKKYENYLNLGICQFNQNKFNEALDSFTEYLDYSDLNSTLCFMISLCLKNTGDIETSNEYYEKYLQLESNN
jgi:glycosyltransferase involved in cell wall biosynthesis